MQFGVTCSLAGQLVRHDAAREAAPDADVRGPWYSLVHDFVLDPGEPRLPQPPITARTEGPRPLRVVLEERYG